MHPLLTFSCLWEACWLNMLSPFFLIYVLFFHLDDFPCVIKRLVFDWLFFFISCWLCSAKLIIQIIEYALYEVKYVHQHLMCSFLVLVVGVYVLTIFFAFSGRSKCNDAGSWDSVRFSKIVRRDYHDNIDHAISPHPFHFIRKLKCISNLRLVVTTNKRVLNPGELL